MDEFVTYVLYSKKYGKIYIGYTSSIIHRYYSHNFFANKGYTIKYRPWIVVHLDFFNLKTQAMKREKWLKSGLGRQFIHKTTLPEYKE